MNTSTPTSTHAPTPELRRPFTVLIVDHRPDGATDDEAKELGAEACDAFTRIHDRVGPPGDTGAINVGVSVASVGADGEPLSFDRLFHHWEMLGHYVVNKADPEKPEDMRRVRFLSMILAQLRVQDALTSSPQT